MTKSLCDTVRAAFPFTVDKLPLCGPEALRTPHYGLFRSDSGACVGVAVRQGYTPHTVDDVCALVEAAGSAFTGAAKCFCHFDEGHFVSVEPSLDYRKSIFGSADNIWPRLFIDAGYGGSAFRATIGYYRDVCRNMGIIRSAGRSVSTNIKHTSQLPSKLDDLRVTFATLAAQWNGVVETAQAMEARQVNLADFIRQVYPLAADATERTRNSAEKRVESIVQRIVSERQITARPQLRIGTDGAALVSAWEAFNGVQGYVQHDSRRRGQVSEFDRAVAALDDAAVSRAMELALAV